MRRAPEHIRMLESTTHVDGDVSIDGQVDLSEPVMVEVER